MRYLIILLLSTSLFSHPIDPQVSAWDSDPEAMIEGCVNVLTGDLLLKEEIIVNGVEPITLRCIYLSGDGKDSGWSFMPHTDLRFSEKKDQVKLYQESGTLLVYTSTDQKNYTFKSPLGAINLPNQLLNRRDANTFELGNKTYIRSHEENEELVFLLESEKLPNGRWRIYTYDENKRLASVQTTSPSKKQIYASCTLTYPDKEAIFVDTSNGDHYEWRENQYAYTKQKSGSTLLTEAKEKQINYHPVHYRTQFFEGRVKTLNGIKFSYSMNRGIKNGEYQYFGQGRTQVTYPDGRKALYFYSPRFYLQKIQFFTPDDQLEYSFEMRWSDVGKLLQKSFYNAQQVLIWTLDYSYDNLGNCTEKKFSGNLSGEGKWESYSTHYQYDSLNRLVSEKEDNGLVKEYIYLADTSLLLTKKEGERRTSYEYDTENVQLGTPRKVEPTPYPEIVPSDTEWNQYNARGQLILQMNDRGGSYHYIYNLDGNLKKEINPEGTCTLYSYDIYGRVLTKEIIDSEGNSLTIDRWEYDPYYLLAEIDPEGNRTSFTYDAKGRRTTANQDRFFYDEYDRVVKMQKGNLFTFYVYDDQERLIEWREEDKYGTLISKTTYSYDSSGKMETYTIHMSGGESIIPIVYDEDRCPPEKDDNFYTYTLLGAIKTITLPSGIVLNYEYDPLGNMISFTSSDGSIDYALSYDKLGNMIECVDRIANTVTTRKYRARSLLKEQLANGLVFQFEYDERNRRTHLLLPDNSSIYYSWGPKFLSKISRISQDKFEYAHLFVEYDLCGFPTNQQLSEGFGELTYHLDPTRSVIGRELREIKESISDYDLSAKEQQMPFRRPDWSFLYDALGRLLEIQMPKRKLYFTYDFLNRRLTKRAIDLNEEGQWIETSSLAFLYDGLKEIGAYDLLEDTLKQLRVCAVHPINTGDDAIAYELDNNPCIPIHDLFGNVRELFSVIRHKLLESYQYSPLGKETIHDYWGDQIYTSKADNPWRFKSARMDEETGLIYLDGDYYDPQSGHFLSSEEKQSPPPKLFEVNQ